MKRNTRLFVIKKWSIKWWIPVFLITCGFVHQKVCVVLRRVPTTVLLSTSRIFFITVWEICEREMQAATHCNTLQHTATHCNTLRHTATYHRVRDMWERCKPHLFSQQYKPHLFDHPSLHSSKNLRRFQENLLLSSVLQCVAVCCSVLQCVAVCCSVNSVAFKRIFSWVGTLERGHSWAWDTSSSSPVASSKMSTRVIENITYKDTLEHNAGQNSHFFGITTSISLWVRKCQGYIQMA